MRTIAPASSLDDIGANAGSDIAFKIRPPRLSSATAKNEKKGRNGDLRQSRETTNVSPEDKRNQSRQNDRRTKGAKETLDESQKKAEAENIRVPGKCVYMYLRRVIYRSQYEDVKRVVKRWQTSMNHLNEPRDHHLSLC